MILCVAGDIHGALDRMYADILAFEVALAVRFDWVLHVGDFGIWPDPSRIDGATRRHDGAGDFPRWAMERRAAPRPTVFIKGNHEDFVWLDAQPSAEVLPGLFYLMTVSYSRAHAVDSPKTSLRTDASSRATPSAAPTRVCASSNPSPTTGPSPVRDAAARCIPKRHRA